MKRWVVARTHPKGEFTAMGHIVTVRSPLFPGYVFVGMDVERARRRSLNSTVGVSELIRRGGRAAPVPDTVIEDLRP